MLGALLGLLALPIVAAAQGTPAGEPGQLPLEIRRGETLPEAKLGRPIIYPAPQDEAAVRQAARASAEFEQAQRDTQFLREQTRQFPRRPDLDSDVTSGIQQRNLQRALPR